MSLSSPQCECWSLPAGANMLMVSCQVGSKVHYLPEKQDSLLFLQILGSFQNWKDLSGIVALLLSLGWAMWVGCAFIATVVRNYSSTLLYWEMRGQTLHLLPAIENKVLVEGLNLKLQFAAISSCSVGVRWEYRMQPHIHRLQCLKQLLPAGQCWFVLP